MAVLKLKPGKLNSNFTAQTSAAIATAIGFFVIAGWLLDRLLLASWGQGRIPKARRSARSSPIWANPTRRRATCRHADRPCGKGWASKSASLIPYAKPYRSTSSIRGSRAHRVAGQRFQNMHSSIRRLIKIQRPRTLSEIGIEPPILQTPDAMCWPGSNHAIDHAG